MIHTFVMLIFKIMPYCLMVLLCFCDNMSA